jgi:hypothetical protein
LLESVDQSRVARPVQFKTSPEEFLGAGRLHATVHEICPEPVANLAWGRL